ncbi:MAG: cobalamin biosynthesis protein CobD [Propionibacterium sp.]|nr:MAG: cobalamin biosynthesis protein CobD [Propionibacterium sp.]
MTCSRAVGLVAGVAADALFGDPKRQHPVAWFGTWASAVEKRSYADSVWAGAMHLVVTLAPVLAGGLVAESLGRRSPVWRAISTAAVTWVALGARSLASEATQLADRLDTGDVGGARGQLPNLCGRDASQLDVPELARATCESVAENTNDAVVCTFFWGAIGGVPGIVLHRAVNTLDAMIGHRNERYERFGKVSAMADDALAWLPARITGGLAVLLSPLVGGRIEDSAMILARDRNRHPSPNGGWCEAAWAGALGVQLGGRNLYYGNRFEDRPLLGEGSRPDAAAVRKSARLSALVTAAATSLAAIGVCCRNRRRQ